MKTHLHVLRFALVSAGLLLALQACGGGTPPITPPVTAVIGSAGGTLSTSSGAKVVIPPGALSGNITIGIEQTSVGSPALPGGFTTVGQMFAFTPHGQTFAAPVTITLPFNPASVPAGGTPELYKNNAQNQWEPVVGATFGSSSVSGSVTSFSFPVVVVPPLQRNDPVREWTFGIYDRKGFSEIFNGSNSGGLFEDIRDFGGTFPADNELLDHEITSVGGNIIPQDGRANGQVFGTADGNTYGVFTEAPGKGGSLVQLKQRQSFIKRATNATLSFTLTSAFIDLRSDTGFNKLPSGIPECNYGDDQIDALDACQDLVSGQLIMTVSVYTGGASSNPTINDRFYYAASIAKMWGHKNYFFSDISPSLSSKTPLWKASDFTPFKPAGGNIAILEFNGPRTYFIDLSTIDVGEEFTLSSSVLVEAIYRVGDKNSELPPSAAAAFLRDPLNIGGTTVTLNGLEPTNNPGVEPPTEVLVDPAPCVPSANPAGVIQFSAASYSTEEFGIATQPVKITRTGGSSGAVTATFTTSNGTAIGGTDYAPVSTTVFFADGDTEERVAEIRVIQNETDDAPSRTVNLTLSQPGGCATLGTQSTAVLTINDDERPPPPPSFTVGGTVTGLVGTGLVLRDLKFLPITPSNGTFTFPLPTTTGSPYAVTIITQPNNPIQTCSVTNGTGTISNANITNIVVNCVTPVVNGALDSSFGDGGKTFTAFGGDETALALQADGKIVMVGGGVTDFTLARYTTAGRLDSSFGRAGTGTVTTDIATENDEARGVAIQSDGKIVVVGSAVVGRTANNISNFDFAVARYNTDGTPDNSFSGDGKVTTDFNLLADTANAVAIQSDGKIVVVGSAALTNPGFADFAIARYTPEGTLDSSFDGDGKLTTAVGARVDSARNIVILANQTILVSGFSEVNSRDGTGLVRYTSSGALDTSFGGGSGKTSVPDHRLEEGLSVQGDGKIVIAGSVNVGVFPARSSHFGVMRFGANGSPDNSFGTAGLVTLAFTALNDFGRAIALQADGKIVVTGQSSNGSNPDFGVARFIADGTPDESFGSGGKLSFSFFNASDGAEGVVIQPDGKIVVGGFVTSGTQFGYGLARVNP
jgi:uncharacterized delta-60 repeat protein